jgi:hypothetical protein
MNQLLPSKIVRLIAREIWLHPDWPPALVELDDDSGYDMKSDLAWQMRLRVWTLGRDLTCYLSTLDLMLSIEELKEKLTHTWRIAFWGSNGAA